ncbi:hypothetical protein FQA39_LY05280 [Lamprigera yunnana]|nr:hypothetical protein FQA39_LY05280 [Lamprigera yunnana]
MSENFDFKTAASLLPKVGNDLNTDYQLIEGIELYEPSLSAVGKPLLINYQSSTAILAQLQQKKQGNWNIDEYGRSIESLAGLIIAQAGDNGEAIATFREANEKIAIDVFTRAIRNRKVQTVTRAKNFKSLSETINVAKEESVLDEQNSIFRLQKWRNIGFQRNGNRDHKIFGSERQAPYKNTCSNPNYRNIDTNAYE